MAMATAYEEPPPPGVLFFLPSHHLVPASSVLYQQTSKADFPYFMHPVLVLAPVTSPSTNSKFVTFIPLVSLHGQKLGEAREAARQSSSISPSPPTSPISPATPGNSPSYILLDQSWGSDSNHILSSPNTTLFPLAKLAPLSLRTKNQLFIPIDRAWTVESSFLTPYPPRQSWSARGKALPNPSMFLTPASLEWVVALHSQKVATATSILRTRSSFATTRLGWGSVWTTPKTVTSEATMPSDVGEKELKSKNVLGLNVEAKEFVPVFLVKVEEGLETKQEKEKDAEMKAKVEEGLETEQEKDAEMKVEEKLEAAPEKDAEKEESSFKQLKDLGVTEAGDAEEKETLYEQWGHLAVKLVDELVTADDLEATKQPAAKAIHEKKPLVTYRKESRFFRAKLPLFNAGKATPKCKDRPDTALMVETIKPQKEEAMATHEAVPSITVVEELSIAQVKDREEHRPPKQARDEWGDWSCVHSKWNSKAKKPKKVHWKEMDW